MRWMTDLEDREADMLARAGRGALQTRSSLVRDLRRLGVGAGQVVLVHSSLSSLGWVCGDTETVVRALLDVLGPTGTLVAYTQTPQNTDPERWHATRGPETASAVDPRWWDEIRAELPPYDPAVTPSTRVGAVAETVRTWPGALRSGHPQSSFAAVGPHARWITEDHAWDCHLGEQSPLARLEELRARILLLGVGWSVCTAFHLAEYRTSSPPRRGYRCRVRGGPQGPGVHWYDYEDVALDAGDFAELGAAWERDSRDVVSGRVGLARSRYAGLPEAVAYATRWLTGHRGQGRQDDAPAPATGPGA